MPARLRLPLLDSAEHENANWNVDTEDAAKHVDVVERVREDFIAKVLRLLIQEVEGIQWCKYIDHS